MTEYLDTLNRAERDALRQTLEAMYNAIVDEEAAAWYDVKTTPTQYNRIVYAEINGKLSTIQAIFELLRIDFEFGRKIEK